jgi:hypothetical protein
MNLTDICEGRCLSIAIANGAFKRNSLSVIVQCFVLLSKIVINCTNVLKRSGLAGSITRSPVERQGLGITFKLPREKPGEGLKVQILSPRPSIPSKFIRLARLRKSLRILKTGTFTKSPRSYLGLVVFVPVCHLQSRTPLSGACR